MESTEVEYIGMREYARRIGCDFVIISRAIAANKIPAEAVKRHETNGRPLINFQMAEEAWGNHYRLSRRNTRKRRYSDESTEVATAPAPHSTSKPTTKAPSLTGPAMMDLPLMPDDVAKLDYKQADLLEKIADMQIKQLKAAEMKGELVRVDAIERVFFDFGRSVRNSFQNIADRIIDQVLSAPSRNEAHILMQAEIDGVLESLSTVPEYTQG